MAINKRVKHFGPMEEQYSELNDNEQKKPISHIGPFDL